MELQIILPKGADQTKALDFGLVSLTEAIASVDEDAVAHGGLGGYYGYGAHWENDVFVMRPFYGGDCDCGADNRSETWHAANPHSSDCFQTILHHRFAEYDEQSGYNRIEAARHASGTMVERHEDTPFGHVYSTMRTELGERAHKEWCLAHDARTKAHARLTHELYIERALTPSPYQWHCTCGVAERAAEYFAVESHYPTCALELPNFWHKASGFEVRWYKWIGRDMEPNREVGHGEIQRIFSECAASLAVNQQ